MRSWSIKTKTIGALAILLGSFALLGLNSFLTMGTTADPLRVVRTNALANQTVAMDIAKDITATQMKIFRFATLVSNGVSKKLLDQLYMEIIADVKAETQRLKILGNRREMSESEKKNSRSLQNSGNSMYPASRISWTWPGKTPPWQQ